MTTPDIARMLTTALIRSIPKNGTSAANSTASDDLQRFYQRLLKHADDERWLCADFHQLLATLLRARLPRRAANSIHRWIIVTQPTRIAEFSEYLHLLPLLELRRFTPHSEAARNLAPHLFPDVIIARVPEPDERLDTPEQRIVDDDAPRSAPLRARNSQRLILHASISCKWTLRSDRGQNARTEALNLTRNRKGWVPHAVLVTAEPLPSRIQSVTGGMGDLDCVYHIALPELLAACQAEKDSEVIEDMIRGRRLRDIADLPLDLAV